MAKKHNEQRRVQRSAKNEFVSLGRLRVPVDGKGQRRFIQDWADTLLSEFDPDMIGKLTCSKRDGWYYILDGQHRFHALKTWLGEGWEGQLVECEVYTGLSEAEEADIFDRLNTVKAVNSFDRFRNRVTAGREVETDIDRIVQAEGLRISRDKLAGGIMAVGTLRRVYVRASGDVLGRALRIIRDAYGDAGFDTLVIDGIGHLCQRYNGQLDDKAAVERLGSTHGGVNGLLSKAEVLRKQTGNSKSHCVAAAAVDIINANRGGKKLASWWKTTAQEAHETAD